MRPPNTNNNVEQNKKQLILFSNLKSCNYETYKRIIFALRRAQPLRLQ